MAPALAPAPAPGPAVGRGRDDRERLGAAELRAYERARPVLQEYCASCHQPGGAKATAKKLDHFSMGGYPFGGHHARMIGATVREVLGVDGGEATMPPRAPGSVQGEQLNLIVAWSEAFDRAERAGLHAGSADHSLHAHNHGGAR